MRQQWNTISMELTVYEVIRDVIGIKKARHQFGMLKKKRKKKLKTDQD